MNTDIKLTVRQLEVMEYMLEYGLKYNQMPALRDFMLHFGIVSPNGVLCHLKALERKGMVKRIPYRVAPKNFGDRTVNARGYHLVGMRMVASEELKTILKGRTAQEDRVENGAEGST